MTEAEIKELKVASVACQDSLLFHTQFFFLDRENRKFVTNDHHRQICEVLEAVLRGELTKVIINIAPRYSKTDLAVKNFVSHALSLNASAKFIHLSYSDDLALDNSEAIKDIVNFPSYQAMFPKVRIKQGSDSKKKWYTTEGGGVYATSAAGQVTGFGAGKVDHEDPDHAGLVEDAEFEDYLNGLLDELQVKAGFGGALIIDDPIKPEDADSEAKRNRINERFDSTIRNRVNSRKTPIIIIMQRLHENDLCGHLMEEEGFVTTLEEARQHPDKWFVLSMPVIQEDSEGNEYALWPFKHSLAELKRMEEKNPIVFGRQYRQNPQPKEGFLYQGFKTYTERPYTNKVIRKAYIDTADTGSDYLCSIVYDETEIGIFVRDILYTQAPMETTEPQTVTQLTKHEVQRALIESNNGGRSFARTVEAQLRIARNFKTKIEWFHQSGNKEARIFTHSSQVSNMIHFPEGWEKKWPAFYKHVTTYLAQGDNKHDDAEDTMTGMVEDFGNGIAVDPNVLSAFA